MTSIACPDVNQSEAYISVAALFLIFASKAEYKVHMRLPSIWRDLWEELSLISKEHQDAQDRNILRELRGMIDKSENDGDQIVRESVVSDKDILSDKQVSGARTVVPLQLPSALSSEELRAIWRTKEKTLSYQQMLPSRERLPIYSFKRELLQTVAGRQVVILCGETGCGKSTQGRLLDGARITSEANCRAVPAYILEHELSSGRPCKVYCTEPRRISALSLARRVSEELGEKKGDIGTSRSLVGYAIRLENRVAPNTRLVYATTGILMRMLEGTDELEGITHLILDEGT